VIAIVLCAGFGTRLYPLTKDRPKALLKVDGRPIVDYLLDQLVRFPSLKAIHVVSNGRFFDPFSRWQRRTDPRIQQFGKSLFIHNNRRMDNDERLGAIGDLAFTLKRIDLPQGAVIAAGDNIFLADLLPVWQQFLDKGENLVLVHFEEELSKLQATGVVMLAKDDRVTGFVEKPAEPPSQWSCSPLYFLTRPALEKAKTFAGQPDPPDTMGRLMEFLVGEEPIRAVKMRKSRLHISNLTDYQEADRILANRRPERRQ
jgi:glucose-1-phosphate thymidylyltransferase